MAQKMIEGYQGRKMFDDIDENYKSFNGLWGESLSKLRNRLVYQRKSKGMICIYCGGNAETREHCPPKSFLKEPYPRDLSILPACNKCNNKFSKYENKFLRLMNDLELDVDDDATRNDISLMKKNHVLPDYAQITLEKVAIGHAIYQLSDGFGDMIDGDIIIDFTLKSQTSEVHWDELQLPEVIDVIPELGARGSDSILIIQNIDGDILDFAPICMTEWIEIQPYVYKYLVFVDGNRLVVKMVIRDTLFVKAII